MVEEQQTDTENDRIYQSFCFHCFFSVLVRFGCISLFPNPIQHGDQHDRQTFGAFDESEQHVVDLGEREVVAGQSDHVEDRRQAGLEAATSCLFPRECYVLQGSFG